LRCSCDWAFFSLSCITPFHQPICNLLTNFGFNSSVREPHPLPKTFFIKLENFATFPFPTHSKSYPVLFCASSRFNFRSFLVSFWVRMTFSGGDFFTRVMGMGWCTHPVTIINHFLSTPSGYKESLDVRCVPPFNASGTVVTFYVEWWARHFFEWVLSGVLGLYSGAGHVDYLFVALQGQNWGSLYVESELTTAWSVMYDQKWGSWFPLVLASQGDFALHWGGGVVVGVAVVEPPVAAVG
jgi:hypothetical protein